ncbi:hypothetical protein NDU88_000339 [Pleurodeles waltl]|uniref:Uncharacterized protein n=1 Tax=Pleurodeles waltl TaxID=8319 RepID=A0AAV7TF65_PLEWA|nr:hypothetical protein NDU88_000339 [Pleurodeles waltl]
MTLACPTPLPSLQPGVFPARGCGSISILIGPKRSQEDYSALLAGEQYYCISRGPATGPGFFHHHLPGIPLQNRKDSKSSPNT